MVPQESSPVHDPRTEQLSIASLLDALADRLAARLLVIFEKRTDVRALTLARLDLDTLRNLLDVAGDAPAIDRVRQLAARVAEQLQGGGTMIGVDRAEAEVEQRFLEGTAHHEAGHIVASFASGHFADRATIVPGNIYAGRTWMSEPYVTEVGLHVFAGTPHARIFARNEARLLLAGEIAWEEWQGNPNGDYYVEDLLSSEEIMAEAGKNHDLIRALAVAKRVRRFERRALEFLEAEWLFMRGWLRDHWSHVEAVAGALLRLGTIDVEEVMESLAPIGRWPVPSRRAWINRSTAMQGGV